MTIKELAMAKCKPLQSTNPKNRGRSMARFFGYQQGALDALKEELFEQCSLKELIADDNARQPEM